MTRLHKTDTDWVCNENKCAILWLELQAEILLDELTSDMSSAWTPTKCRSSLRAGPSFSYNSSTLPVGKEPRASRRWDQTHRSSLLPSPSSVTGPYGAWSRGGLAGLHHRHRGLGSALQPLAFCTVCDAAGCLPEAAGCHSGRGCRDVGCGGLWTTSASPSGVSQTRQGTSKRTQT